MANFNVVGMQRKPQKRPGFSETFKATAGEALANMLVGIPGQALQYGMQRGLQELTNDPTLLAQKEAARAAQLAGDKSAADVALLADTYDAQTRQKLAEMGSAEAEAELNRRMLGTLGTDIIQAKKAGLGADTQKSLYDYTMMGGQSSDWAPKDAITAALTSSRGLDEATARRNIQADIALKGITGWEKEQNIGLDWAKYRLERDRNRAEINRMLSSLKGKGPALPKGPEIDKILGDTNNYLETPEGRVLSPLGKERIKVALMAGTNEVEALRRAGRPLEADAKARMYGLLGSVTSDAKGNITVALNPSIEATMAGAPPKNDPLAKLREQLMKASIDEKKALITQALAKGEVDSVTAALLRKELGVSEPANTENKGTTGGTTTEPKTEPPPQPAAGKPLTNFIDPMTGIIRRRAGNATRLA